jgi:ABC-2 type transport system permease protein
LALFFTLAFPVMVMALFGFIFGNEAEEMLGGYGRVDLSVPGYIGMIIGTIGLLSIPTTLALFIAGLAIFDLRIPNGNLIVVPAILLSAFSFFAVGFVLAGVMPSARTAQAVGMAIFYPMLFLSGAAMPRYIMPDFVQQIAGLLPLTHVVILVEDLWLKGTWNLTSAAVVALVLILGLVISRFTFRWE